MAEQSTQAMPPLQELVDLSGQHMQARRWSEAEAVYRRILTKWPGIAGIHYNLGVTLTRQLKAEEALEEYRRAVALEPGFAEGWNNLGSALRDASRPGEAIEALRKTVSLRANYAIAWSNLGGALKEAGYLDDALVCYDRAMALEPANASLGTNRLQLVHYHPGFDAAALYGEAKRWNDRFSRSFGERLTFHHNTALPQRRLRVGYVSSDFRRHCASIFISPLFEHHDRAGFEIFAYAGIANPDGVTARLRARTDQWRNISEMGDVNVARLILKDGIDILVDLSLHTAGNRMGVFALKPAPIQVTWLGYPGTTGLDAIDYRLTDPRLDPADSWESEIRNPKSEARTNDPNPNVPRSKDAQDSHKPLSHLDIGALGIGSDFGLRISDFSTKEDYYSERSVRLPDTFWCYDPRGMDEDQQALLPEPSPLPALSAGYVTFGSLNNFYKASDRTLSLWAKIMAAMPSSKLIMVAPPGPQRQPVLEKLGVTDDRVEFVTFQPRHQYLETYRRIDLCLDTLPFNGGTTSLDAMWMGVPVVTLVGNTVVGRAGWSQLYNLNLMELVTRSDEEYVKLALDLAGHLDRLAQLRQTLRRRMEQSPLMDGARFARNMEVAYRQMWRTWCERKQEV